MNVKDVLDWVIFWYLSDIHGTAILATDYYQNQVKKGCYNFRSPVFRKMRYYRQLGLAARELMEIEIENTKD